MTPEEFSAALQALGLRQSDYARLIEVSQKTLWTWTAGRVPIPKLAAEHVKLLLAVNALHRSFIKGLPGTGVVDPTTTEVTPSDAQAGAMQGGLQGDTPSDPAA